MISNSRGFSFVEVLIALAIMAVGVMAVIKMQSFMDFKADNALKTLDALYLAEEKLEQYHTRSQSAAGGTIAFGSIQSHTEATSMAGLTVTRVVTVIDDMPVPDAKKVTVEVIWNDRFEQIQSVSLETVISKYSEFD
ncbi:prepilin-type cleavage/methylation domain-containing protein [Photobacterium gaetbulicola]|uniref:Putative type IV pilin n=1 Tax=Photobacterium gaetbulicola Gung47 TaxID=658445 RepID=A0A0C5WDH7_9GAMM|nr:prepilin-type N-terminal cleavage/methylation domain-containing protein [Photobacterium gaetbulicola]AJR09761.1 putative type IV pilin [Photobacterium gaetbulicola Gung47]PSU12279.1 prepilin-type cleavage/methylation domain-containing protein [Photobacterium gaetbulicola]